MGSAGLLLGSPGATYPVQGATAVNDIPRDRQRDGDQQNDVCDDANMKPKDADHDDHDCEEIDDRPRWLLHAHDRTVPPCCSGRGAVGKLATRRVSDRTRAPRHWPIRARANRARSELPRERHPRVKLRGARSGQYFEFVVLAG